MEIGINYNYRTKGHYENKGGDLELVVTNVECVDGCLINTHKWSGVINNEEKVLFEVYDCNTKKQAEELVIEYLLKK